ncbi:MAG: nickel pincer cofactor biosynthesis protein LarB [Burkholderiaceae bacterium]
MSNDFQFDWSRQARTHVPEVVFAEGKQVAQIVDVLHQADARKHRLLLTRFSLEQFEQVLAQLGKQGQPSLHQRLTHDAASSTAVLGDDETGTPTVGDKDIAIVCAGSSDLPVALEAQQSLRFLGRVAPLFADVGVAGLWRLTQIADELAQYRVLIAVAGMEGALFSVVAGLVPSLVIAVPRSVGYGVAAGGQAALSSALASCAPGIVCVNIDNGFGAAAAAHKMLSVSFTRP